MGRARGQREPTAAARAASSSSAAAGPVAVQAPPARLRAVIALHDTLVGKVRRRRAVRDALVTDTRTAVTQVAMRMHALVEEAHALDREIHALMQGLVDDAARSQGQRAELARIYEHLEGDVITRRPRGPARAGRGGAVADHDDAPPPRARGPASADAREAEAFTPSRPKPSERGTLRALFRRLAEALHPDKVQDEAERARRTEVMKQVTVAYQEGDFARLLEIELAWAAAPAALELAPELDGDELERRVAVKERAIAELQAQLAELEREIRRLRRSEDGQLARAYRVHGGADGRLPDEVDAQADVARMRAVRDFIAAFRDGEMSFARFRQGPGAADDADDADDALEADDVLDELDAMLAALRRGGVDPRDLLRAVRAAAHGAGVGPRRRR